MKSSLMGFQGLLGKIPDQIVKILRLPVWNGIMDRFLRYSSHCSGNPILQIHHEQNLTRSSDEFASYTGSTLVPQKSGYMLNATTAIRLVPGARAQPLHRVRIVKSSVRSGETFN